MSSQTANRVLTICQSKMIKKSSGTLSVKRVLMKTLIKNYSKDLEPYVNFVSETLINLLCCYEKVFILMNTLINGKYLMKHHFQTKKLFILTEI